MSPLVWIVTAFVVLAVLDYMIFNTRTHRPCKGTGWLRSPISGAMRRCYCDGGKRPRWGLGRRRRE